MTADNQEQEPDLVVDSTAAPGARDKKLEVYVLPEGVGVWTTCCGCWTPISYDDFDRIVNTVNEKRSQTHDS